LLIFFHLSPFNLLQLDSNFYNYTFLPPVGAGANLQLGLFYSASLLRPGISSFETSTPFALSNDTFSYSPPSFTNNTLALVSAFSSVSTNLRLLNTYSQRIKLNGTNFCSDETAAKLFYGPPDNPLQFDCVVDSTLSTSTILFCDTADFSQGTDLMFTYVALNQEVNGTDLISFPAAATIFSAAGCAGISGIKTIGCNTAGMFSFPLIQCHLLIVDLSYLVGGQILTLNGQDFRSPIAVFVRFLFPLSSALLASKLFSWVRFFVSIIR
jgi:hypothetical protein